MVQGSASEPYRVTFQKSEGQLSAFCTCPAGANGQHCKHRLRILEGKTEGIVDRNEGHVTVVRSWLPGTELEAALIELAQAERELELAKAGAASAKRRLASVMTA